MSAYDIEDIRKAARKYVIAFDEMETEFYRCPRLAKTIDKYCHLCNASLCWLLQDAEVAIKLNMPDDRIVVKFILDVKRLIKFTTTLQGDTYKSPSKNKIMHWQLSTEEKNRKKGGLIDRCFDDRAVKFFLPESFPISNVVRNDIKKAEIKAKWPK